MKAYLSLAIGICLLLPLSSYSYRSYPFARGDGKISIYNVLLKEEATIRYRGARYRYLGRGLNRINALLRSRTDHAMMPINKDLIELIDHLEDHFGVERVEVVSGYRSPKFNAQLRRRGRHAARHSYHMQGMAMDIRLPGVSSRELRQYLLGLRAGGVGHYPHYQFIHVDVGPFRTW